SAISRSRILEQRTHAVIIPKNDGDTISDGDPCDNINFDIDPDNLPCRVLISLNKASLFDALPRILEECEKKQLVSITIPLANFDERILKMVFDQSYGTDKSTEIFRFASPRLSRTDAEKIIKYFNNQ
uniref:Uncharacterized protein n=1 Tax=Clytia hemisphaerica TaxID=252671 RepID=A0A7M5WTU4_9CNID